MSNKLQITDYILHITSDVLARARGLQERIRPIYTWFQGEKWATFAPLKEMLTHDQGSRSPLGPPTNSGIAPASSHFTPPSPGVRDLTRSLATLSLIFRPFPGEGDIDLPPLIPSPLTGEGEGEGEIMNLEPRT